MRSCPAPTLEDAITGKPQAVASPTDAPMAWAERHESVNQNFHSLGSVLESVSSLRLALLSDPRAGDYCKLICMSLAAVRQFGEKPAVRHMRSASR
jgi:hypothetical protein